GHQMGDELLRLVAERIRAAMPINAEVARLGGDEFAVMLHSCVEDQANQVAQRLLDALATPLQLGETTLTVHASVGMAEGAIGDDVNAVLRHADIAMYSAKRSGKSRVVPFEASMQVRASQRMELEQRLRQAIAQGVITLNFQPVIDMQTGAMGKVEVLARWVDADFGVMPPAEFVALAEECGQINALGRHVLFTACRQAAQWRKQPSIGEFAFAVNVSARELDDDHYVEQVEQALSENGLPASALMLELTESAMLNPRPQLRIMLERLRRLGVRLSLDDFGAGYSSLTYLHRFRFDELKIDRALVERVGYSAEGTALVSALLAVAQALKLEVVAEGVEHEAQQAELLRIGCRFGQGYLLARPMAAEQLIEWIANAAEVVKPATT
ncbi:MAG: bifunctional diguanylate cyclase/phosphodiesterase, partial [Lysobacteraceae bacterium]